jgi:hypothetical protein
MRALILLLAAIALSGCATILQPGPDYVPVASSPHGAAVYLDGELVGHTPMMVAVPRRSSGSFRFVLEDGRSETRQLRKVVNGWIFADAIFLPAFVIPALAAAAVDLAENNQGKYPEDETLFVDFGGAKAR